MRRISRASARRTASLDHIAGITMISRIRTMTVTAEKYSISGLQYQTVALDLGVCFYHPWFFPLIAPPGPCLSGYVLDLIWWLPVDALTTWRSTGKTLS
jgi:hypothetical protein